LLVWVRSALPLLCLAEIESVMNHEAILCYERTA